MKKENQTITSDLREQLKTIMANEIKNLPDALKELTPAERINVLLKLMPFVVPKVEAIECTHGEPFQNDW